MCEASVYQGVAESKRMPRIVPRAILLILLAVAAGAQSIPHANFSGRWRMLKDQSDFGKFSRPDLVIRVIDQHDPTLNLHTVDTTGGKTTTADISYFTDGRQSTNNRGGREATSKAFWDGSALMIRTQTTDSKNEQIEIVERWELSADGKTLTTTSDSGGAHLKLVCEKEADR
jgi:hypothetical protein